MSMWLKAVAWHGHSFLSECHHEISGSGIPEPAADVPEI